MLKITPGLTKRVLSMRLRELERDGFIEIVETRRNYARWDLTEKGRDTLPILMAFVQLGSRWYAEKVFFDKKARTLGEIFEESYVERIAKNFRAELSNTPIPTNRHQ